MTIIRFRRLVVRVLALALLQTPILAQSFKNPYRIPTSTDPFAIAAGDLNGDGIADFVWVDTSSNPPILNVLLSQPSGGWLPAKSIAFPIAVTRFAGCLLANVNDDKHLDLVCADANQFTIYIHVFLGNGDGTFQAPIATTVPSESNGAWAAPILYPVGDLNGDGFSDFYEIEAQSQEAQILLSDGKGGFKPPIPAPSSINSAPVVSGDVNGDGIPDLLFTLGPEIALGKGDGSFGPVQNYAALSYYDATCVFHDMEGNGHLDAVCGYAETITGDITGATDLIVLHGNADGSFNTTPIAQKRFGDYNNEFDGFGTFMEPVAVADINGDGIPDVLGASGDGLAVLLGGPSLSFSTPLHYARADGGVGGIYSIYQSLIFDVNGDGIPDTVDCGPNGIYIGYGRLDGTFASAFAPEVTEYLGYPTIADFNGDGIPDIAATGDTAIKLSIGKGDGTFAPPVALPNNNGAIDFSTPSSATNAHIVHGDFNGDGKIDLMAIGSSSIYQYDSYILFGNGDGTFREPILVPDSSNLFPMQEQLVDNAVVDINHDGRADILSMQASGFGVAGGQLSFALSNGDGTFKQVSTTVPADLVNSYPIVTFPALADFDGDGKLDAVYGSFNHAYVVKGHGDGSFDTSAAVVAIPPSFGVSTSGAISVATGDFDGDGNQDVVLLAEYTSAVLPIVTPAATAAWVYFGDGKGGFSTAVLAGVFDRNYTDIAAADLNKDGRADIVVKMDDSGYGGYAVGVIAAQPGRSFGPEVNYTGGTGLSSLAIVDINMDGWPDLVFGNGDYNIRASSVTELINLGNASVVSGSLSAAPEPSIVTQLFTLTATLTPPLPVTLSGTIYFSIDGSPTGSATLSANKATLPFAGNLSIGKHTLSATWAGDATYPSLTFYGTHEVVAAPTSTTIASSQNPVVAGTNVTFTVTVTSSYGMPAGTVTLSDGGAALGVINLSNGSGTFSTSALTAGTHNIAASYAANGNFAASSASLQQVVQGQPTTTSLSASPNPAYVGQRVTLTATVVPGANAGGGGVSFLDGATSLGSSIADANGIARMTVNFSSAGVHDLTAVYGGNQTLASSTSAVFPETIVLNPTAIAVSGTPNPATVFQTVFFTAQLTSTAGVTPTGSVVFYANGAQIGVSVVQYGKALFSTAGLGAGTYAITASYSGDASSSACNSIPFSLVVNAESSQVGLTSNENPAVAGSSVTFIATVSAAVGTPTGTVQFYDGPALLGSAARLNSQGSASYSTSTLTLGTHSITAAYSGSRDLLPSTSAVLKESIVAYVGDFTITVDPTSASIYTGELTVAKVTVQSVNGFNQPLALLCSGLPSATTCTFSPASIANGQGVSTLTIQTSAPHQVSSVTGTNIPTKVAGPRRSMTPALIAALALLFLPRRLRLRGLLAGLAALYLVLNIAACASPSPITGGTAPGSYTLTITAANSNSASQLEHSAVFTLTVKSLF